MIKNRTCPTDAQFAQALSNGDGARFKDHFAICDTCCRHWEEQQEIREILRCSERNTLEAEVVVAMRANLLEEALLASEQKASRSACLRPIALTTVAAVAIFGLVTLFYSFVFQKSMNFHSAMPARMAKGAVYGDSACDFVHLHNDPDEIVRLKDGAITVNVDKLNPDERFRVITGDAEVEVRGTAFDVVAKDDALVSVKVHSGRVDVRVGGRPIHHLAAGDTWERTDTTPVAEPPEPQIEAVSPPEHLRTDTTPAAEPPEPRLEAVSPPEHLKPANRPSVSAAPRHGAVAPTPKTERRARGLALSNHKDASAMPSTVLKRSPAEAMFIKGWDAFKRGAFRRAVKRFEEALVLEGHHTIAQDASFWRAAALAKANDTVSARAALKDFLQEFPASPRVKEASVILGWNVLESDPRAAKEYFERGKDAVDPKIRKSAAKGLDAAKDMLEKKTD
jgi:hypothetical protein